MQESNVGKTRLTSTTFLLLFQRNYIDQYWHRGCLGRSEIVFPFLVGIDEQYKK